jgi:DNA-binding XRE family transcriptional regulator
MKKSLTLKRVKPLDPYKVRVTWSNGLSASLDLADAIARNRSLAPLRDASLFGKVKLGEWGHAIHWTDDIELGAESLWRRTLEAIGRKDVAQFIDWRLRHGLSLSEAAEELGLSRRMVAYYESGRHKVPKTVLLACKGWEAKHDRAA